MDGFLLSRADRTLRASGVRHGYDTAAAAVAALAHGDTELVVGALPFDPERPAALSAPDSWEFTDGPWRPGVVPDLPPVRLTAEVPEPAEHVARVRSLVDRLRGGVLGKVVAARSVTLRADAPISPEALAARMIQQNPTANGFAVDLSAAGDAFRGHSLVGASPEVLLSRRGRRVTCRPLAGTAPRRADPEADEKEGRGLLESTKNLAEHAFVTAWIEDVLTPLCTELTVPETPVLTSTHEVWHLATPIDGVLRDPSTSALSLATRLHPTPAVCGTPTDLALATIRDIEGDRRFYGGAVGWCDGAGDGDWVVAIRCAEITADGREALATAGGGIVAESDPESELDETTTKLRTLLRALGVQQGP
ncbi:MULTISPECIES: isochorismate synthase MenF [unclassified Rhodococcus (in: high G+C Gram-positive bacteria)]|uniref:isochorismate synthase n=1 Tax=unclassified Rhodococcus (in: high G+C Gram-positive bacteria) TaxID=192944 RepID=UPI0016396C40|nr:MULTISPECIES: isochorismate synthase [unclassified Rhodococcus (in: high G+C Gram-positive bacteria)]MBC2642533.1 isochorismate synthase [Rhodococcus sp. 3A]MBC2892725.1 isochorismate synthase [Rhodococcus sp. 4CII]